MFVILLLQLSAWAQIKAFSYEIRHHTTAAQLTWDGEVLFLKDRTIKVEIKKQKCNEDLLRDFLEVDASKWRNRPATTPDPIKVKKGEESFEVAGRSDLGRHLLSLTTKLRFLSAEASAKCR